MNEYCYSASLLKWGSSFTRKNLFLPFMGRPIRRPEKPLCRHEIISFLQEWWMYKEVYPLTILTKTL